MSPRRKKNPEKGKPPIAAGATADCVLPEELMISILTRLPVKSIVRFKSVCKPWLDFLSSPEFIKLHQGQFSSNPDNQSVIIESRNANNFRTMFIFEIESDEKKPTVIKHPDPEIHLMNIVGCCNGLICMGRPRLQLDHVVLWNPAAELFKFVSFSENVDFTYPESMSLGFGYDAEVDDFKVVIIFGVEGEDESVGVEVDVEVYSVNSDSWTTIKPDFLFKEYHAECLDIVNGNPYWFATVDENKSAHSSHAGDVLVWLDVRNMVFKALPVSTHNFHVMENAGVLVDWKGSLGTLVCNRNDKWDVKSVDVWVFDDGKQIWRKDHTFGPIEMNLGAILQISKNGKLLCSVNGKLFVFDPETGWFKAYDIQLLPSDTSEYLYTESLICIKGMETWATWVLRGRLGYVGSP